MNLNAVQKVYFIGIGGSSMSSLAEILQQRGFEVCGSDVQQSHTLEHLQEKGIKVIVGHKVENISSFSPQIVIKTDAIMETNPELIYAIQHHIPVYRRAELLGEILDGYQKTIGVAGTHGKTTTTSMITSIFLTANKNPSAIVGGHVKRIDSSYLIAGQDLCIFESCEFKDSFLHFHPDISVILNIARDHMEYFKTEENLIDSFHRYLYNTRPGGTVVANCEDENSVKMLQGYEGNVLTFGLEKGDFTARNISMTHGLTSFDVYYRNEGFNHTQLSVPGRHNVMNALAASAASFLIGLDAPIIAQGLHDYTGTCRRFDYHCKINGAIIADDYGHHPDAYRVTFQTARDLGFKRIIAIHQPHTFSRTKMMMNEFVEVLKTVDHVLIPPIYPARETNDLYHVSAQDVVRRLSNAEFVPDFEHIADRIKEMAQPGDLFITLGCGDIYKAAELTAKKYGEEFF